MGQEPFQVAVLGEERGALLFQAVNVFRGLLENGGLEERREEVSVGSD